MAAVRAYFVKKAHSADIVARVFRFQGHREQKWLILQEIEIC